MVCNEPRATRASVRPICDEGPHLRQRRHAQQVSRTACHHAEQSVARSAARVRVADRVRVLTCMPSAQPRTWRCELCHDAAHLSTRRQRALRGALAWSSAGCSFARGRVLTPDLQNRTRSCSARAVFEVPHRSSAHCGVREQTLHSNRVGRP